MPGQDPIRAQDHGGAAGNLAICALRLSDAPMSPQPPDGSAGPWKPIRHPRHYLIILKRPWDPRKRSYEALGTRHEELPRIRVSKIDSLRDLPARWPAARLATYRVLSGIGEPNNSRNVAEVLRRNETLCCNSAHDYEPSSLPKRKRKLIGSLTKGDRPGQHVLDHAQTASSEPHSKAPSVIRAARVLMAARGATKFYLKDCKRPRRLPSTTIPDGTHSEVRISR